MFLFLYIIIGFAIGIYQVSMSYVEGLKDHKDLLIMFLVCLFFWLPFGLFMKAQSYLAKRTKV